MRFGLIGCAGYIAPRHLQAIKDIGGDLVCALDKSDSVGILDRYFKNVEFFTEFERFDRYCDQLRRVAPLDFISICSPNYLHDAHCRFALRAGANAICEKPLVIKEKNILPLVEFEKEYGKRIYPILQLRYHEKIIELKNAIEHKQYKITLNYFTPRGNWYHRSWKADIEKSGGLLMNIGVHFIDMLIWLYGDVVSYCVNEYTDTDFIGSILFEKAEVNCHLSINQKLAVKRELIVDGNQIDFTSGFSELHTICYKNIIEGNGFGLADTIKAISFISKIKRGQ